MAMLRRTLASSESRGGGREKVRLRLHDGAVGVVVLIRRGGSGNSGANRGNCLDLEREEINMAKGAENRRVTSLF
jgi:hypothetical protein